MSRTSDRIGLATDPQGGAAPEFIAVVLARQPHTRSNPPLRAASKPRPNADQRTSLAT